MLPRSIIPKFLLRRIEASDRARRAEPIYRQIIAAMDRKEFIERFRSYWDPFPTPAAAKYLNLDVWLRDAVDRAVILDLDRAPRGRRIVDLGSGTGYFLHVCRHLGHEVFGLDLDAEPLYNEMIEYFDLPRIVHRIEPATPLPDFGERADLITAFMIRFHAGADESIWDAREWRQFLCGLTPRLKSDGQIYLRFNRGEETSLPYSDEIKRTLLGLSDYRASFDRADVRLQRRIPPGLGA